jgi:uncharacterized protein YndB with AHSA1/START domain
MVPSDRSRLLAAKPGDGEEEGAMSGRRMRAAAVARGKLHGHRRAGLRLLVGAAWYAVVLRPRILRWGATDEEVATPFPGAEIVPGGSRSATMATTIDAPPSAVWPWLVQMGTDRAGWYSWDRLDNFGRRSATRINPAWQHVRLGDRFRGTPDGSQSWEVVALQPASLLVLRMCLDLHGRPFDPAGTPPKYRTDSTWGFQLSDVGGRTRFVVSGYWALSPRWLQPLMSVLVLEPSHWVMQTRQFSRLKRLAEQGKAEQGRAEQASSRDGAGRSVHGQTTERSAA